jgi:hypothetical protein
MLFRLRRYILMALLVILPLQGTAATLHAFTCAPQADHVAAASADEHTHAGHDHDTVHKHADDSNGGTSDHSSHQCCHHLSAAPPSMDGTVQADLPVLQSSVALLEVSFILEQPQRPPRA